MIIGITGGTGCGKTTALDVIRELGGVVLDCDAIYHQLLASDTDLLDAIEARFPGSVEGGVLQRKKLGAQVFSDPAALADLNRITHGAVKREVCRRLEDGPALAAIDAIALFESGLADLCDTTVAITAPREERIARLMAREGIDRAYAEKRIDAQHTGEYYSALCRHTLTNDRDRETFRQKCLQFFRSIV